MLAMLMCFSSAMPSFAYDLDASENSVEEIVYQNTEDEDYDYVTNVFAEIGSEYKVTIPKTIVLSGTTKSADYYVKVDFKGVVDLVNALDGIDITQYISASSIGGSIMQTNNLINSGS